MRCSCYLVSSFKFSQFNQPRRTNLYDLALCAFQEGWRSDRSFSKIPYCIPNFCSKPLNIPRIPSLIHLRLHFKLCKIVGTLANKFLMIYGDSKSSCECAEYQFSPQASLLMIKIHTTLQYLINIGE
jgi:hypothetical protein